MSGIFKPMLASDADLSKLQFPLYASPKLDGVRASVVGGKLLTRALKEIPNRHVYQDLSFESLNGLDGELVIGSPSAEDAYRRTVSGVMSREGTPDYTYWVFDLHDHDGAYTTRYENLKDCLKGSNPRIKVLSQTLLQTHDELLDYESRQIDWGYEGVILRRPDSPYKFGRATAREGYLLKLKRFEDSEAVVLSVEEEMFNGNEATLNELGRTKRSTAKAGLVPKGRMGKLHVRDLKSGVEFHLGTGFTDADKAWWWDENRAGLIVKYKFFPVGVKDLPRHPVYLGLRDPIDM